MVNLVDGLSFDSETISNWQSGVARALKQYIKDGTKIHKQKCPNFDEESLVFQEKCPHCTSCGWSRCS